MNLRRSLSALIVSLAFCIFAAPFATLAESAEEVKEPETLDPSLSRMYRTSSAETLDALVELLEELKIDVSSVERESGRIKSRSTRYKAKRFKGLSVPTPYSAYGGSKIRVKSFVVYAFVSPFAEPARVHITSRINFERFKPPMAIKRDHLPEMSAWLLDKLDEKLGQEGMAIPLDDEERFALARSVFEDVGKAVPSCLESVPALNELMGVVVLPEVLEGHAPPLRYPRLDVRAENEGFVEVGGRVLEDGYFVPEGLTENESSRHGQLAVVTYQWSRHQEFRPAKVGVCPAPAPYALGVNFFMKQKDVRQP